MDSQDPVPVPEIVWDLRKARSNLGKHKVSFEEAATALEDPLSTTKPDPDHSISESRFLTLGLSFRHRLVLVAHTDDSDEIRIISARLPTRSERYAYEDDNLQQI
ncbi:MAG: BrnT family toxin [Terracidiphilus sp.]